MTNRVRVLHISSGNLYGGVERVLATLASCRRLCPDMEPHFALCFDDRIAAELRATGAPLHLLGPVRVSRPWTVLRARRALGEVLAREAFDFVVCPGCWPHALFAPVVRRADLPLAFWSHDVPQGRHWLERWAARTPPDLVIANSKYTQAAVPQLFPHAPSEVVYCPVPPPRIDDPAAVRRAVRQELGTPEEAVVIVMASRMEPLKGHAVLIEALAGLKGNAQWRCWIAGGVQRPAESAYCDKLVAQLGRAGLSSQVRLLGQRTDIPHLFCAADIYCQPNVAPESFGLTFVEAMYAGLPVATSALGGALESVDDTCGVLVQPGDAAALASALRLLLEDSETRQRLGVASFARALTLCDPALQLPRLHELLAGGRVPA